MPLYDSKAAFVLEAIHSAEVKKSTLSDYEVKKPDTKWVDPKINLRGVIEATTNKSTGYCWLIYNLVVNILKV